MSCEKAIHIGWLYLLLDAVILSIHLNRSCSFQFSLFLFLCLWFIFSVPLFHIERNKFKNDIYYLPFFSAVCFQCNVCVRVYGWPGVIDMCGKFNRNNKFKFILVMVHLIINNAFRQREREKSKAVRNEMLMPLILLTIFCPCVRLDVKCVYTTRFLLFLLRSFRFFLFDWHTKNSVFC